MSNTPSISPAQIELLLKMAGKQLNIDPNALRQQLEQGDLNALGQRMGVPAEQLSQAGNIRLRKMFADGGASHFVRRGH